MTDRNYPSGSKALWDETEDYIKNLFKCDICKKHYDSSKLNSLYSISESGESLLTVICDICVSDKKIMEKLVLHHDNELELLDTKIRGDYT